jgi:uncharacterized protein (TIGR02246 family)
MQKRTTVPAAVAIAVLLAGCNQAPPPAPDTREKDAQEIRDLEIAWQKAFATRDVDQICTVYAEDASVFMPNAPVLNGSPAIKEGFRPIVADKHFSVTFASTKVQVARSGDLAYSQGAYTMTTSSPRTKQVLTEVGKYVTVYKKQPVLGWKVVADIINADAPAAPAKQHKNTARTTQKHRKSAAHKR